MLESGMSHQMSVLFCSVLVWSVLGVLASLLSHAMSFDQRAGGSRGGRDIGGYGSGARGGGGGGAGYQRESHAATLLQLDDDYGVMLCADTLAPPTCLVSSAPLT